LIISKTPLRISFFGGGTDYPDYFTRYGSGAVLGTTIDKYVYCSTTKFYSALFDYSIRISYKNVECVNSIDEIRHAPFRECLRLIGLANDIEVDYTAELPAFTGLGSSSSFIVGVLNSLLAFKGEHLPPLDLAKKAIMLEREILKEPVGCQDQTFAAIGGFNLIKFNSMEDIAVTPVQIDADRLKYFEDHLLLLFTGIKRKASDIIEKQMSKIDENKNNLQSIRRLADEGFDIITNSKGIEEFGGLLDKNWHLKRSLDDSISNGLIDQIYETGIKEGALGGKLLGAGGGGFILFFVPPKYRNNLLTKLSGFTQIPLKISFEGSKIL
jgi:D-glycero-alpha-D-manno-heptose-7-phosphate kinase